MCMYVEVALCSVREGKLESNTQVATAHTHTSTYILFIESRAVQTMIGKY